MLRQVYSAFEVGRVEVAHEGAAFAVTRSMPLADGHLGHQCEMPYRVPWRGDIEARSLGYAS